MPSECDSSEAAATAQQLLSNVLKPGSSLNPSFLLVLDCTFSVLLLTFVALLLISGSLHILMLIVIELGLWIAIKWFVHELKNDQVQSDHRENNETKKTE